MNQIWTKQRCAEEAAKNKTRLAFARGGRGAYRASLRNRWCDEICAHVKSDRTPSRFITKEVRAEEGIKNSSRGQFQRESKRFGFLDDIALTPPVSDLLKRRGRVEVATALTQ
jgi:hypothetical protein